MARNHPTDNHESAEEITFEAALEKLEQIVRQLEEGQLGLTQSLARYEEGVKYLTLCHEALNRAERKIMLLTGVDAGGNPLTEPFGEAAMSLEEKRELRDRRRSRSPASAGKKNMEDAEAENRPHSGLPQAEGDDMDKQRGLF